MNFKMPAYVSLLSFSCIALCMDVARTDSNLVTDVSLQKLIKTINNSSLHIVTIVQEHARYKNITLDPQNIGPLLQLDQQKINQIFLDNVDDDHIRPLILSMGADIKAREETGRNCLFFTQRAEVLTQLLDKGAEVDTTDKYGKTPLSHLFYWESKHIAAARVLLAHRANPNVTCLHSESILFKVVEDANIEATTLLCEYKANPNFQSSLGETPLLKAIKKSDTTIVEILLKHGANANLPDEFDKYPLHAATSKYKYYLYGDKKEIIPAIVILLLQYGANPNRPYRFEQRVPLHRAVELNNMEIIRALIEHKAETHHCDENGRTPLALARHLQRSPKMIALLSTGISSISQTIKTFENISTQSHTSPASDSTVLHVQNSQDQQYCSLQ